MRQLAIMLALAGFLGLPAMAEQMVAGISGHVVDIHTGRPIAHARLLYYKTPYLENGPNRIFTLKTDRNGFFRDITLEPGRYVITSFAENKPVGCAVDDVQTGEVTQVKIEMGRDRIVCSGPRVHPTTIDPNLTADLYRI